MKQETEAPITEVSLQDHIPLTNQAKPYYYTVIICLSTLYSGCCLTLISSCNLSSLIDYYAIDLSTQSTLSLLNGVLPAGGMLGALLVPSLVAFTTKKKAIYYMAAASIGLCLLSIIPQLFTCLLSRFLLGVLNALHMSLAGAFIKEIFPSSIRSPLGGVYSTSRIFGMLICFFFAYMAEYTVDKLEHIFIFLGPAFVSILQAFLFYQFMPDSIVEMITKQEEARAKQGIALFYPAHQVERRYLQMRLEIAATVKRTHSFEKIQLANRKNLCSLHLAMLRQFCGETYIVIYAREVMKYMDSPYANITPAVVNSIQLLAGLLGIIAVQKVSRFSLLVTSCCVLAILNVFIGITDLYDLPLECLITMTAFMMPCGVGLSSVAWSYPSELVPASQGKYSSFVNWTCSTMVAVIPPYVVAATSVRNAYPVFFFFAFYLVIAFGINLSVLPRVDRPMGENERTFLIPVR